MKKAPLSPSGSVFLMAVGVLLGMAAPANPALAQEEELPPYLRDRGTGMVTSQFGTYVREGELLFYPFFEYYRDKDMEYKPADFGFGLDEDFRGRYRASEGLIFLGYGLSDRVAAEIEASVITATLKKSPQDPSTMPARFHESGLGDVEGQLRVRWAKESERRPEVYTFFETAAPLQKNKSLIGTQDWEFTLGAGLTKGFTWGTVTVRAAAEYLREEGNVDIGEYAVEYLKRLSPHWRIYLGVEGEQDEVSLIPEAQWHVTDSIFIKLNSAFALSSKATDWAPEVGIVFSFR